MSDPRPSGIPARALVLTAGLGTRLQPLTYVRAKGAVPVNGETLARRIVRWLADAGVHDQVLNLHHLPSTIAASVGDGSDLGVRVRYSWENPVLGSAGGPRHALPLLTDRIPDPASRIPDPASRIPDPGSHIPDPASRIPHPASFLIVNGDTLTDVDLHALAAAHAASGAAVTMALIPNPRPDKYGGVHVSDGTWVSGFSRKGAAGPSYHFIGVQIAEARAFADLADGTPAETVNALYPRLIASDPHSVGAFVSEASFHDIGTPIDYLDTSRRLAAVEGDRMGFGRHARIDPSASISRSVLWDDVKIGAHAHLADCIVCDGAEIPAGARYERCAIVPAGGRQPGAGERIEGTLLIKEIDDANG